MTIFAFVDRGQIESMELRGECAFESEEGDFNLGDESWIYVALEGGASVYGEFFAGFDPQLFVEVVTVGQTVCRGPVELVRQTSGRS